MWVDSNLFYVKANLSQHKSDTRLTAFPSSGNESLGNGIAFGVHFIAFHPNHVFLFEPSLKWKWVLMHSLLGRFSLIFYIGCKHSMKFILSSLIARAIGTLKCISIAGIYGQFPHATLTPSGFGESAMTLDMIAALKGLSVPADGRKVLQLGR